MWMFRAMTTEILVTAPDMTEDGERELAREVEALFRETERRFSRFDSRSELAQLNRAVGPTEVSPELLDLLVRARTHASETRGIFEPAVGSALQAAGYDRSFAPGALDDDRVPGAAVRASVTMLEIDEDTRRVTRPPHVQLDFGGFLKGRTADRAAALARGAVVIDAGGDAVLRGAPAGAAGWTVDIEDPRDASRSLGSVVVRDEAVATSATNRRRWRRGDRSMHHLIDPRTITSAATDLIQATVFAPSAELADVMAKVAVVLGTGAAAGELERRALSGVLVASDGSIHAVGGREVVHA